MVAMMSASLAKHRPSARARQIDNGGGRPKKETCAPRGAQVSEPAPPKRRNPPKRASEAVAAETGTSARTVERVAAVEPKD